ncbi:site-specific DNA-methyltransferase [Crossiella sp. SN42]|uniref:DNA-methyltransferase n=1 Tax=Crossiella sp. SN42 TaxID=2944808 RepID=UPI00207C2087|nr:site-specific DNA-methyltransferase [Crossiella sp. SN42]MCO1575915.1 site-specific DNA-methyltransferase [Crossiella sp. SN42]
MNNQLPPPHYRDNRVTLYTGDATETLARLPERSVHCVVTSPPYWGLRDYGTAAWTAGISPCPHTTPQPDEATTAHPPRPANRTCSRCGSCREDRQYGQEPTPQAYINTLRAVFAQLHRVLVDTGTVWLNLGDRFSANSDGYHLTRPGHPRQPRFRTVADRPHKNLLGMPWRVAFALQDDGWILRNAIVWHKPNAMPESVRDRLSCRHEMLFLLAKQPRYYFNLDPIRQPLARPEALNEGSVIGGRRKGCHGGVDATARRRGRSVYGKYTDFTPFPQRPHGSALRPTGRRHNASHPRGRNPGDVWSISTRPLPEAHFAAFPIDIPLRCIAASCPPGGTVLDPFSGAGTTGLAARRLDRIYLGIDLNPAYHDIALGRMHRDDHVNSLARSHSGAEQADRNR